MSALRLRLPRPVGPVGRSTFGGGGRGSRLGWRSRPGAAPRPPVPWEVVATEAPLRVMRLEAAALADGHRLTIQSLAVGTEGARLTFTLEPNWLPPGIRPGRAPLPLPEGLAMDPAGSRYTIVPGATEGDPDVLTGELLVQPPPPADAAWLDVVLTMDAPRSGPGPLWRLRLPLDGAEGADG